MSVTNALPSEVRLLDLHPPRSDFRADVLEGLRSPEKSISPMYFYDAAGSALFDAITDLPEYYPTRTELAIMDAHLDEMADLAGPGVSVIEFGAGSGLKTRQLLAGLHDPIAYVPVEISREFLLESAESIAAEFPELQVLPVCADFTRPFQLPEPDPLPLRNLVYFPGSTIGNFTRAEARNLLQVMHTEAAEGGALLIGVDLRKDRSTLERAYNDDAGVTAGFNLNLLERMNRELGAEFDPGSFEHRATWNPAAGRIEMRLVSRANQQVNVAGQAIDFAAGEAILTEYSHKYELDEFAGLAAGAGFAVAQVWTDPDRLFSVQFLTRD
ncbi:MAG: L-histidine N(alpha)-methyltransferase [Xanthomonadales bacterium]|nr:L-histidine N(alpha)-methyltransferase [Xanthomonadales bacterium]